jgi:hypothetical protein
MGVEFPVDFAVEPTHSREQLIDTPPTNRSANQCRLFRSTSYEKALVLLFILTLPLCNPWVRGDGVGYYAFARSILIEHRLDFTKDWLEANETFRMGRTDAAGNILANQYTATGHLNNHFSIGPAILWAPFLIAAHLGVLSWNVLGGHVLADGYSAPYRWAMALGTATYAFLGLLFAFSLARTYVGERGAFLGTLGVWFASSLPVYMYFNPSWAHALSAFAVAVFLWFWMRTRGWRTWAQWAVLGLLGGLMMDVYYVNAIVLLLPLVELLTGYWLILKKRTPQSIGNLLGANMIFAAAVCAAFSPTLLAKEIIYGSYFHFGYTERWFWSSPAFWKVCFSSQHGLFSWTPVALLSVIGLVFLRMRDRGVALSLLSTVAAYVYAIGCYQNWHGISSYGSRFLVALTPLFVIGLAAFFERMARTWPEPRAALAAYSAVVVLSLWNLGLIFQWGMHLIPERGPISWRAAAYNQVAVVPRQAVAALESYLTNRKDLMDRIEQTDRNQLPQKPGTP